MKSARVDDDLLRTWAEGHLLAAGPTRTNGFISQLRTAFRRVVLRLLDPVPVTQTAFNREILERLQELQQRLDRLEAKTPDGQPIQPPSPDGA
jgi:hypothetical protein